MQEDTKAFDGPITAKSFPPQGWSEVFLNHASVKQKIFGAVSLERKTLLSSSCTRSAVSEHEKEATEKANVSELVCFSDFSENSGVGRQCGGHVSFSWLRLC